VIIKNKTEFSQLFWFTKRMLWYWSCYGLETLFDW